MRLDANKLKSEVLLEAGAALGLELDAKTPIGTLVQKVGTALRTKHKGAPIMACGNCGFPSPDVDTMKACPACGAPFAEDAGAQVLTEVPPVPENGVNGSALVVPSPAEAVAAASNQLDLITAQIRRLKADLNRGAWEIGERLREVRDKELWKAKYRSFSAYIEGECTFTRQTGMSFIAIREAFEEKQIEGLTVTQLRLVAKLPEGEREKAVDDVKNGRASTTKALAKQVTQQRKAAGLKAERPGLKGVLLNVRLEPGEVAVGKWTTYKAGLAKGRFKIGDQTFLIEVKGKSGFRICLKAQ